MPNPVFRTPATHHIDDAHRKTISLQTDGTEIFTKSMFQAIACDIFI